MRTLWVPVDRKRQGPQWSALGVLREVVHQGRFSVVLDRNPRCEDGLGGRRRLGGGLGCLLKLYLAIGVLEGSQDTRGGLSSWPQRRSLFAVADCMVSRVVSIFAPSVP